MNDRPLSEEELVILTKTDPAKYNFFQCAEHGVFAEVKTTPREEAGNCWACKKPGAPISDPLVFAGLSDAPAAEQPAEEPHVMHSDGVLDLTEVEQLAGLQFPADQVAVIMGVPLEQYEHDVEFTTAMRRGVLIKEAQLRKTIFEHAENGSSPAQVLALQLIVDAKVAAAGNN